MHSNPPGARSRLAARTLAVARWALAAASLGVVVWYFAGHGEDLARLGSLDLVELAALAALFGIFFWLQAARYRLVIEAAARLRLDGRAWLRIFILGRFLNFLLPQTGNLYRAVELKRRHDIRYTRFVASMAAFGWIETLLYLLLAIVVLAIAAPDFALGGRQVAPAIAVLAVLALAGPFALDSLSRRWTSGRPALAWVHARAGEVLGVSVALARRPLFLARFVALGALSLALGAAIFHLAFRALDVPAGTTEVVLFFLLLRVGVVVHVTPANLGVLELGFGLLGEHLGVGLGTGILVSGVVRVLSFAVLTALALPLGGLTLLRRRGELPRPVADAPTGAAWRGRG